MQQSCVEVSIIRGEARRLMVTSYHILGNSVHPAVSNPGTLGVVGIPAKSTCRNIAGVVCALPIICMMQLQCSVPYLDSILRVYDNFTVESLPATRARERKFPLGTCYSKRQAEESDSWHQFTVPSQTARGVWVKTISLCVVDNESLCLCLCVWVPGPIAACPQHGTRGLQ